MNKLDLNSSSNNIIIINNRLLSIFVFVFFWGLK